MNQAPSEQDAYLLKKCGFLILCDIATIVFILTVVVSIHLKVITDTLLIGIIIVPIIGLISTLKILSNNTCPVCGKNFFHRWSILSSRSYSMYTKKCAHCGYKLQK
jgi:hypothetical protein